MTIIKPKNMNYFWIFILIVLMIIAEYIGMYYNLPQCYAFIHSAECGL